MALCPLLASCGGSSEEATTATTPATITGNGAVAGTSALQIEEGPLEYVPMGNSLTFTPSPNTLIARYTAMLEEDFGVDVEVRTHTVGDQRTDDFPAQLRTALCIIGVWHARTSTSTKNCASE